MGIRVAVMDLGSTSFRLVVAEADHQGRIVPLVRKRARLELGRAVGREGRIPKPDGAAAVETVARFRRRAERAGAEHIVPVATSALRDAANREKLARRLEEAAGEPVRFLSGDEEAALAFTAMRAGLGIGKAELLGADLGGGSLELAAGNRDRIRWTASLDLGACRLAGRFPIHPPMTEVARTCLGRHVEGVLRPLTSGRSRRWPSRCVASGGTAKAIARIAAARRGSATRSLHGLTLGAGELVAVCDRIISASPDKLRRMPGADPARTNVLGAGALVMERLVTTFNLKQVIISTWGLREGIILETLGLTGEATESDLVRSA
jgi:exopolyphosphatase/guanosine-5'-triphosphate,3'-diphosphate pyrophosphatase